MAVANFLVNLVGACEPCKFVGTYWYPLPYCVDGNLMENERVRNFFMIANERWGEGMTIFEPINMQFFVVGIIYDLFNNVLAVFGFQGK